MQLGQRRWSGGTGLVSAIRDRLRKRLAFRGTRGMVWTGSRRMASLSESIAQRRTFAIISHPDAGKTTLTEKLLLFGGAIQMAGAVKARGDARRAKSDWMKVERERGISVASSVMTFEYRGCTFNLLDTPGHEDFSEDTYRVLTAVDSANLAWLKPLLLTNGWPTREALGSDGVEAVFLLVQHADRDPAFQAAMLPFLESAYREGEIDGQSLALLTDRVAKAQGRPQVYGTQTTIHGRDLVIDPIADSEAVDARRAQLGLPPLAVYKHMLDSVLAHAGAR